MVGTGFRTLNSRKTETFLPTLKSLGVDASISLLIAFGLGILYLVGGISYTSKVVDLNNNDSQFASIALTMSLLGLAAGALIPSQELLRRLENVFAQK